MLKETRIYVFNIVIGIGLLFTSCKFDSTPIQGIWIPEVIDWQSVEIPDINQTKKSSFHILDFEPSGVFFLFSSTQALDNDSIYFQSEPGIVICKGVWSVEKEDIKVEYRTVYQTLKIDDDSKIQHKTLPFKDGKIFFEGTFYEQGNTLTVKSRRRIKEYIDK